MKTKELKIMNDVDLENKITDLKKELMKINSQIAIGMAPKNPSKVSEIKSTIAKILTIKHEKTLKKFSASQKPQSDFLGQEKIQHKTEASKRNE